MVSSNQEDLDNIKKFKGGDTIALEFVFNKYKIMINSIARRYFLVGGETEDLIQEGMIGLYKACLDYSPSFKSNFKTFAFLCIKRQIQSAVKSANRQKNIVLNNAISIDFGNGNIILNPEEKNEPKAIIYFPSYNKTPESELIEKENYNETISKIKKSLSKFELKILSFYLRGYKNLQIANFCKKDIRSIENAISRIKIKLRFLNFLNTVDNR